MARQLTLDGQPVGRIFIHAETLELAAQMRRYAWIVLVLLGLALTLSVLLAERLQRRVSGPILRLADRAVHRSHYTSRHMAQGRVGRTVTLMSVTAVRQ